MNERSGEITHLAGVQIINRSKKTKFEVPGISDLDSDNEKDDPQTAADDEEEESCSFDEQQPPQPSSSSSYPAAKKQRMPAKADESSSSSAQVAGKHRTSDQRPPTMTKIKETNNGRKTIVNNFYF